MEVAIHAQLKARDGKFSGQTLGGAIVDLIDQTSVGALQQAGPLRLLNRTADRIAEGLKVSTQQTVEVGDEEAKAVKKLVQNSVGLQAFYHRQILGLLWPEELEAQERKALFGEDN